MFSTAKQLDIKPEIHELKTPRIPSLYDKIIQRHGSDSIMASIEYNRWLMVIPAVGTHLC